MSELNKFILSKIKNIFNIREGETSQSILMFAFIFFIVAALLVIKPVRNSLFLTQIGVANLPVAFLLVAIFSAFTVAIYSKYTTKLHVGRLTKSVLNISILSLLVFWGILHFELETKWVVYVFYIWVSIFGVIATTQFWLLANFVFTSHQAKRLFGFIGAGAISGGIFGGYLTNSIADLTGTVNLLLISTAFLVISGLLSKYAWVNFGRKNYSERTLKRKAVRTSDTKDVTILSLLRSNYLMLLASLVGISVLVANLADYQFNLIASENIKSEDELTAFFGFWLSNLSIISLIIQFVLTSRVLRKYGVGVSLLFLPLAIMVGAGALILNPGIISALIIKVGDGAFKQSINKAGRELLSIPIATEIKNKIKVFIDVFVDNFATGISGIILLALTLGFGIGIQGISLVSIFFIFIWLIIIYKIKKEYVNTFRKAIESRAINLDDQQLNLNDAAILENILPVLNGKNKRQILYILNLLENVKSEKMIPYLKKLLSHESPEVKSQAIRMIREFKSNEFYDLILPLVDDPDIEVKNNAISYLCIKSDDPHKLTSDYIHSEDLDTKIAAMLCTAEEYKNNSEFRENLDLEDLFNSVFSEKAIGALESGKKDLMKIQAANFIGTSAYSDLYPKLYHYLESDSMEVQKSALINMGRAIDPQFIDTLLRHLGNKTLKIYAKNALVGFGEDLLNTLADKLSDKDEEDSLRLAIAGLFGQIYSDSHTHVLSENLLTDNRELRFEMIKSLNKLKANFPDMNINSSNIQKALMDEIENQYWLLVILFTERREELKADPNSDIDNVKQARSLLIRSLGDKIIKSMESIFRLLGLKYESADMYNAYLGIKSRNKNLREDAIEFLDNSLNPKMKNYLISIIEQDEEDLIIKKAKMFFNIEFGGEEDCINAIISNSDNWLRTNGIYLAMVLDKEKYIDYFKKYENDSHAVVSETAKLALVG